MRIEDIFKKYGSADIVFDPIPSYDGNWIFELKNLHKNAIINDNKKNLFDEFLKEIYVIPIKQMFKSSSKNILKFNINIISSPKKDRSQGRCIKFCKDMFYKSLLNFFNQNIDILKETNEEHIERLKKVYNNIFISDDAVKLAFTNEIKEKLKKIEDLKDNEINSKYYDAALIDYEIQKSMQKKELSFRQFLNNLDTIFNDLLKGIILLSDFFDREIDYHKLYECFDKDVFYLLFAKIIYEDNLKSEDIDGKLNDNYKYLMYYREALQLISKEDEKYNPILKSFVINDKKTIQNYNRWEFTKELESLIARHNEMKTVKLPEIVDDPDKYKDIDLMAKLKLLINSEFQKNWEFLPKGKSILKNNQELLKEDNGIEILDSDTDLIKETNMRIDILMESNFIMTPLKGKNSFLNYYAFIYQNGVVVLEKFWQTKDLKPARECVTYIINIDNFIEMNKMSKITLTEYMRLIDNSSMKRVFHDTLNSWQLAVFKEINNEIKYDYDEVFKYIINLQRSALEDE